MGTPRQLTQVAFAAPLDQSTEDEILDPTVGFPVLENVRQDRRGGISKRLGFDPQTTTRTSGRRLFQHRDSVCVVTGDAIVSTRSESTDTDFSLGRAAQVKVTTAPLGVSITAADPIQYDAQVAGDFLVLLYADGIGRTLYQVITLAERIPVLSGSLGSHDVFRLGVIGTTITAIYASFAGSTIGFISLDCSTITTVQAGWDAGGVLAAEKSAATGAVQVHSMSNRIAVAYPNNDAGASRLTVRTLTSAGPLETRVVNTASVTPDTVGLEGSIADTLWVAWNQTNTLKVIGLDADALATTLATTATVASAGSYYERQPPHILTTGTGAAQVLAVTGDHYIRYGTWTTVAGIVTPGTDNANAGAYPASKMFLRRARAYGLFATIEESNYTRNAVFADATEAGRLYPNGYAYPRLTWLDPSANVLDVGDDQYGYVVAVQTAASVYSYALVTHIFSDNTLWRPAFHNGSTFLAGGVLSHFTGDRVQEAAFLHPPMYLSASDDSGGTGPTGDVSYVAVFECTDGAGNYSVSGVSDPLAYTGTGVQVFVQCDPLLLSAKGKAAVAFYRTVTNGTLYYRITVEPLDAFDDGPVIEVDVLDDAALISQPLLYGTGLLPGVNGAPLQHDAPPFSQDVVSYNGMLVLASGSDLWWSGQAIGGEGTWFSTESFFLTVDGPGDIIALAVQDGTLYVLKERAIYAVAGEPPSDNGSSGGLGQPRKLAGDVGCVNAASIVVTSLGIFFRSTRGIELLSGGRATWIGEKVQNTLAAYPDLTSAVVDERNNLVRFSLSNGYDNTGNVTQWNSEAGTDLGGRDLVFDLTLNEWQSEDDKSTSGGPHLASQDACVLEIDGVRRYAWLSSGGTVYVETDEWRDDGEWIYMGADTGWFKLAGIQGRQQFNRLLTLFRKHTACDLSVSVGYEYRSSYSTTNAKTEAQLAAIEALSVPLQLRTDPDDNSEGQAIRVRIADASPTTGSVGTGRGATWLALTFDITPREGPAEVPEEAA